MKRSVPRACLLVALLPALLEPLVPACRAMADDPAALRPGAEHAITLRNGDTLRARVVSVTADGVTIDHEFLGRITLAPGGIAAWAVVPDEAAPAGEAPKSAPKAAAPAPVPGEPPPIPGHDASLSFFRGWTGSVAAGINGSDGNSETFNGRITLGMERLRPEMETRFDSSYLFATNQGEKSQSRGVVNIRNDWLFQDSPWGFFAQGRAEYDEFQNWRWRLSAFAGPSYTAINTDETLLRFRVGAGLTRELGGDRNDIVPEGLAGIDFRHRLTAASTIYANFEYLPSLKDFSEFRTLTSGGYEVMLDEKANLSLRLGAEHRHNSDPGAGSDRNDIEYFALIGWSF
jgi:hypothetical protein